MSNSNSAVCVASDQTEATSQPSLKAVNTDKSSASNDLTVAQHLTHLALVVLSIAAGAAVYFYISPVLLDIISSKMSGAGLSTITSSGLASPQGMGVFFAFSGGVLASAAVYLSFATFYKKRFGIELAI